MDNTNFKRVTENLSVSPQITVDDVQTIRALGFKSIICNRPDGESVEQVTFDTIKQKAEELGMTCVHQPVPTAKVSNQEVADFKAELELLPKPTLAYCRTGTRSITLWSMGAYPKLSYDEILKLGQNAGYDLAGVVRRLQNNGKTNVNSYDAAYSIVIVGGGAGGIATAASIKSRSPDADIVIIDPSDIHYYQPGWTLVGRGVFSPNETVRTMASIIPEGVKWIQSSVAAFLPEDNLVIIDGCRAVKYEHLIVCPGIKLDWDKIEGLSETLGQNGVTSNYRFDLAPYTWELVQNLKSGKAVFSQPPMPIKCAGAPQKAMYLSSDYWYKTGALKDIEIEFYNAGGVLFGVKEYVPALMEYVEKYNAQLNFSQELVEVKGKSKTAIFKVTKDDSVTFKEVEFDMLHVVPPQSAPDFIKTSPLVDNNGWIDVDQSTLQHKKYPNIFALGDAMNAPNAKTAAAARMQAPVVATNLLYERGLVKNKAIYNGYGSCPLTVEVGKVVLAEFGYGGKILNSFPTWFINDKQPSALAWYLKEKILPAVYWQGMLKGREWMINPEQVSVLNDN